MLFMHIYRPSLCWSLFAGNLVGKVLDDMMAKRNNSQKDMKLYLYSAVSIYTQFVMVTVARQSHYIHVHE